MNLRKIDSYEPEYWEGKSNVLIRVWTYAQRGLEEFNRLRYFLLGIFGVYALLKFTNPWLMVLMFAIGTPLLVVFGRWWLFKGSKSSEYVSSIKGSVLGYNSYNASVTQVELLQQIFDKINERTNTIPTNAPARNKRKRSNSVHPHNPRS